MKEIFSAKWLADANASGGQNRRFWIAVFGTAVFLAVLFSPVFSFGKEIDEKIPLYFFYSDTCSRCAEEKVFLSEMEKWFPGLEIKRFEVWNNKDNLALMAKVGEELSIDAGAVPLTIIGQRSFIGYLDDKTTGQMIKEAISECVNGACPDRVIKIISGGTSPAVHSQSADEKINIPILGEIDPAVISLPILSIVIGGMDGFNPCAMWILIFLVTLLLGMEDKKRRWILGGVFILTSAFVYFMFMAAWLNFFLFLGMVWWVRIGVALAAIASGVMYLKKYFTKKAEVCEISQDVKKQKILEKLKASALEKKFWLAIIGIIILAGAVNLFELLCSAGFPAIYTKVLSMNNLPMWQYYGYMLIYLFFFMLDDIVVFTVAMLTLQAVVLSKKYNKISVLVGGLFMLAIGFLLLFRPEILSFKF